MKRFRRREYGCHRKRLPHAQQMLGEDEERRRISLHKANAAVPDLLYIERQVVLGQVKRRAPEMPLRMIRAPEGWIAPVCRDDHTAEKEGAPIALIAARPAA